jgi:hypothetical protein
MNSLSNRASRPDQRYKDVSLPLAERVDSLVSQMTRTEKIALTQDIAPEV